jgi:hypothetical protein
MGRDHSIPHTNSSSRRPFFSFSRKTEARNDEARNDPDEQPVETIRRALPAHAVGKGKEVHHERGGSVSVMVTMDNVRNVSPQPGGTYHEKTVTEKTNHGYTTAKVSGVAIESPNVKQSFFARLLNRDEPRNNIAGGQDGSDQQHVKQKITYLKSGKIVTGDISGRIVTGDIEGTTGSSSRGGAGEYRLSNTTTEITAKNGDRYYTGEGKGTATLGGWLKRQFSSEREVVTEDRGYRAADQTKVGTSANDARGILAKDVFVMRDAKTGDVVQIKETEVKRYLDKGDTVTVFTHELNGKNGKSETRSTYEMKQDPRDHSKYSFTRLDDAKGFKLAEAGQGRVELKNGKLVITESGGYVSAGAKLTILSLVANLGLFSRKTEQDLELTTGKNGEIGVVASGTSKSTGFSVGHSVSASPVGGGPGLYASGQGSKTTIDEGRAFTDKLIGSHGAFGEPIVRIQAALEVIEVNGVKGFYHDPDGRARPRNHPKGSPTVAALDAYFENGGTVAKLEKLANSREISNHPAVLKFTPALREETDKQMIARADMPLYHGPDDNRTNYSAKQIRDAQEQAVDKIDGIRDDKPVPRNMTKVLIPKGDKLKGVDVLDLGTYGYQVKKGVDTVIMSMNNEKISLNPAGQHMVEVNITEIRGNQIGKTYTSTIQAPASLLPDLLHIPVLHGRKEHEAKTPKRNDDSIPDVDPGDCCPKTPPQTPPIAKVKPDGCCGGLFDLFRGGRS